MKGVLENMDRNALYNSILNILVDISDFFECIKNRNFKEYRSYYLSAFLSLFMPIIYSFTSIGIAYLFFRGYGTFSIVLLSLVLVSISFFMIYTMVVNYELYDTRKDTFSYLKNMPNDIYVTDVFIWVDKDNDFYLFNQDKHIKKYISCELLYENALELFKLPASEYYPDFYSNLCGRDLYYNVCDKRVYKLYFISLLILTKLKRLFIDDICPILIPSLLIVSIICLLFWATFILPIKLIIL